MERGALLSEEGEGEARGVRCAVEDRARWGNGRGRNRENKRAHATRERHGGQARAQDTEGERQRKTDAACAHAESSHLTTKRDE